MPAEPLGHSRDHKAFTAAVHGDGVCVKLLNVAWNPSGARRDMVLVPGSDCPNPISV